MISVSPATLNTIPTRQTLKLPLILLHSHLRQQWTLEPSMPPKSWSSSLQPQFTISDLPPYLNLFQWAKRVSQKRPWRNETVSSFDQLVPKRSRMCFLCQSPGQHSFFLCWNPFRNAVYFIYPPHQMQYPIKPFEWWNFSFLFSRVIQCYPCPSCSLAIFFHHNASLSPLWQIEVMTPTLHYKEKLVQPDHSSAQYNYALRRPSWSNARKSQPKSLVQVQTKQSGRISSMQNAFSTPSAKEVRQKQLKSATLSKTGPPRTWRGLVRQKPQLWTNRIISTFRTTCSPRYITSESDVHWPFCQLFLPHLRLGYRFCVPPQRAESPHFLFSQRQFRI